MSLTVDIAIDRLRKIAPERYLIVGLALLAAMLWWAAWALWPRPLEVVAFAVGKGDAFLIRSPNGHAMMIDGGSSAIPDVGTRVLVPNLMLLHVRTLDAIMISHPDSDHINGLEAVMNALPVKMFLDPQLPCDDTSYLQLLATVAQRHIPSYQARAGGYINLGGGVEMHLLAPGLPLLTHTASDTNNNCIVCKLTYRRTSMLFTGDLEFVGEDALLRTGQDLHADVLKVAHHGSKNGTSFAFLDAVRPTMALLSCPGTTDHPHVSLLARLQARGIRSWRTDVSGQLDWRSYGDRWQVTTYLQR
jgi:beta-lactamase superfamily II metal-dependent hydrolase